MTEQTDASNLAATGNAGNAPAAGSTAAQPQTAVQTDPAAKPAADPAPAAKTLDTTAGTLKPASPLPTAGNVAGAKPGVGDVTHHDNIRDGNHIDPATGKVIPAAGAVAGAQTNPAAPKINPGLSTDAGKIAQHEVVDKTNEKRNEANAEGHAKNMEREQKAAQDGLDRQEKAGSPPTGKQRDENTPTVLPDGTKVWKA